MDEAVSRARLENADEKALKRFRAPEGTGDAGGKPPAHEGEAEGEDTGGKPPAHEGGAEGKDAGGKPLTPHRGKRRYRGRNGATLSGCFFHDPTRRIMDGLFASLKEKKLAPAVGNVYDYERIREAAAARDEGRAGGKIAAAV